MELAEETQIPSKNCRYCASQIPIDAKICPTCKFYQSPIRNWIVFVAGAASLITLCASFFVYSIGQWANLRKNLSWKDDIDVLFFETQSWPRFSIVVVNRGDGPIHVSEALISYKGGNSVFRIHKDLDPATTYSNNTDIIQSEAYGGFISNEEGKPPYNMVRDSNNDIGQLPCYFVAYFAEANSDIARMNEHYKLYGLKLITDKIESRITFYSPHFGRLISKKFDGVAVFQARKANPCKS